MCDMGAAQTYCSLFSLKKGNILPLQLSSVDDAVQTLWGEGQFSYHCKICWQRQFQQFAPSNTLKTEDALVLRKKGWRVFSEDIKIDYKPVPKV